MHSHFRSDPAVTLRRCTIGPRSGGSWRRGHCQVRFLGLRGRALNRQQHAPLSHLHVMCHPSRHLHDKKKKKTTEDAEGTSDAIQMQEIPEPAAVATPAATVAAPAADGPAAANAAPAGAAAAITAAAVTTAAAAAVATVVAIEAREAPAAGPELETPAVAGGESAPPLPPAPAAVMEEVKKEASPLAAAPEAPAAAAAAKEQPAAPAAPAAEAPQAEVAPGEDGAAIVAGIVAGVVAKVAVEGEGEAGASAAPEVDDVAAVLKGNEALLSPEVGTAPIA